MVNAPRAGEENNTFNLADWRADRGAAEARKQLKTLPDLRLSPRSFGG
jgi:hypothetical protein